MKLNTSGVIQWQNTIGGSGSDDLYSIQQTNDEGYVLGGWSNSNISGEKTENSQGNYDYWVVKLDSLGVIQWQNTIGGSLSDFLSSIQQTSDRGYVLGGWSNSNISGDKTENSQGFSDYWVVKLDSLGVIQWQNTIGGSANEALYSLQQTSDRGYVLGGWSQSDISGDKTENSQGGRDYWVVKLNNSGVIQWQKTIGGSDIDHLRSIQQTSDGGYVLGGWSSSNISGDKTDSSQGGNDYWVVKLGPDTTTGINFESSPDFTGIQLKVYPNPSTGGFIIEIKNLRVFQNLVGLNIKIKLLNINGQVIYAEKLNKFTNSYRKEINMKNYPKGIYTLQIISDSGIINKKVVLE